MPGHLFIIAGPSGVGKSTLERMLFDEFGDLAYSVSATTRPPRPGEVDGRDYFFVSRNEFDRMIEAGELAEWAEFYGHRYGTPARFVEETLASGRDLVIDVEVEGVEQLRGRFGEAVYVLIAPPSLAELERRLTNRATESGAAAEERLNRAKYELAKLARMAMGDGKNLRLGYDYIIINDDLETAYQELRAVIIATRVGLPSRIELLEAILSEER